jgi:predicted Zn-dependent protease
MLGIERVNDLIELALAKSKADQTEVQVNYFESFLTRFANSQIHQNVAERNANVQVRCCLGRKIGTANTNVLEPKAIEEAVASAVEIAGFQLENPDFVSLPKGPFRYPEVDSYSAEAQQVSAADRAEAVGQAVSIVKSNGLRAFGVYTNGASEIALGNSLGVRAFAQTSDVYLNVVAVGENSSGYVIGTSRRVRDLNVEGVARQAVEKAKTSADPTDLEPGVYEVILEPLAAGELADFLGWMGFGARAFQEGRSFLIGRLGTRIADEKITIVDDAFDPAGFAFPFDWEGVPKQRVELIRDGIAKGLVYDTMTADKEGKQSTGHALGSGVGPGALNLQFAVGSATQEQMIANCRRGVLVSRFHYTNVIDPMKTTFTGMTRDGTFLIENGRIARPVKNLRFTQSILDALSKVKAVGRDRALIGGGAGYSVRFAVGTLAPALHLAEFNFTGKTEF